MNKCKICGMEVPDNRTMCVPCLKRIVDKVCGQFEEWKKYAEELREEQLFDLKKYVNETARELKRLESEKGRMDIPIGDFYESVKYKPSKWIVVPDFMDDVENICPTCGKKFFTPDGTSVAHYFIYCPFCGDKIED